ncbi:lipoprotein [Geotalea uraniireducens]|uniref:Lipoprotein n=1 Tax=Geotalea uraniireducens TaxID=351604 RepID=A0ABM8EMB8_9BACT|nr:hypothetical protein [Geotalea uraniireducens]BDV43573.1 lipoprotein [Geotalea uraniireducens]
MTRHPLGKLAILLCFLALLTNAGCAAYSSQIAMLYDPVTFTKKGSGDLYLVTSAANPATDATAIRWVIGSVTNRDGVKIDDLLSTMPPAGMVQDALSQELRRAGYNIISTTTPPQAPGKMLDVVQVQLTLNQLSSLTDVEAKCRLAIGINVWKKGAMVKKLHYESKTTDYAIKDRELLAGSLLRSTMQEVMTQAVPEIVNILEQ